MKNFDDITYPDSRSYYSNLETTNHPLDFYMEVIPNSKTIDLLLGYFTSSSIRLLSTQFAKFISNDGILRIVANHVLSPEDMDALLSEDYEFKDFGITESKSKDLFGLSEILSSQSQHFYDCLRYLLLKDRLIFVSVIGSRNQLVHYKRGLYSDKNGNQILTVGSSNFTRNGILENIEQVDIYLDWEYEKVNQIKISDFIDEFSSIITKKNEGFKYLKSSEIYDYILKTGKEKTFNELVETESKFASRIYSNQSLLKKLNEASKKLLNSNLTKPEPKERSIEIPPLYLDKFNGKLFSHQEDAIEKWFSNNGKGILKMATGSGKTVTGLSIVTKLINKFKESDKSFIVVIVVPYRHLVVQWNEEAVKFGFNPILCFGSYKSWKNNLIKCVENLTNKTTKYELAIVSNATFSKQHFQEIIKSLVIQTIILGDEAHNFGSPRYLNSLPPNFRFRIGLSATPERHMDPIGTQGLYDYFGKEIINYGIKEAIEDGTLCRYNYFPIIVHFTEKERRDCLKLNRDIGILMSKLKKKHELKIELDLKKKLLSRSRLVANADNKLIELLKLLKNRKDEFYNLVYCGDEIEYDDFSHDHSNEIDGDFGLKQVDKILGELRKLRIKSDKFTSTENITERQIILERFRNRELQTLVAIRCLDEGVDVKRTENAYILASSSNPKQFIQRRGRVLRTAKGKSIANIYDFVLLPQIEFDDAASKFLIKNELKRIKEFAGTSENEGHTLNVLRPFKDQYNIF